MTESRPSSMRTRGILHAYSDPVVALEQFANLWRDTRSKLGKSCSSATKFQHAGEKSAILGSDVFLVWHEGHSGQ